jgi:hypothetical protein
MECVMPEATADLTTEDVTEMTWDELTLAMLRKGRADAAYEPSTVIQCPDQGTCSGCTCDDCFGGVDAIV